MFDISTAVAAGLELQPGTVEDDGDGFVLVRLASDDSLIEARTLRVTDGPALRLGAGDEVLLAIDLVRECGYVLGAIDKPRVEGPDSERNDAIRNDAIEIVRTDKSGITRVTGKRIFIDAEEELQIRCGDATILINRNGKIVVKGESVTSRARGLNKIKGAAVSIN
ncbi:MAG: hypothetical protein HKN13_01215 [Rhodothermales bacterium]|nr:hypothetical protein [Rhodothermales bacterium]